MDKIQVFGLGLFGFVMISAMALGGSLSLFFHWPSLLLVLGGGFSGVLLYKGQRALPFSEILFQFGRFCLWSGAIGHLIGNVQMLANLSDPKKMGPALAVSLLSVIYGLGIYILSFATSGKLLETPKGVRADILALFLVCQVTVLQMLSFHSFFELI